MPDAELRRRAAPVRLRAQFFSKVIPWGSRQRQTVPGPERGPMVGAQQLCQLDQAEAFCAATAARTTAPNASMRCERVSPSCDLASTHPVVLTASTKRTALAEEAPNRCAAPGGTCPPTRRQPA